MEENNNRVYLGIDPGAKGFITLNTGGKIEFFSIADLDIYVIADTLGMIKRRYPNVICVMEEVHAIFGSSAKSTFNFGEINGILKGVLMANKIPYHLVQPKVWQKEIWANKDYIINYKTKTIRGVERSIKEINTKATSINAAKRLFPAIDFRKNERCKNIDDNKVDSLLIAEYGRRKNL